MIFSDKGSGWAGVASTMGFALIYKSLMFPPMRIMLWNNRGAARIPELGSNKAQEDYLVTVLHPQAFRIQSTHSFLRSVTRGRFIFITN